MEQIDNLKELINQGDVDTAIKQLDQLLQDSSVEKEKDTLYYLRGNAYRKKGDWKQALDNYQYAIELNPDSPAVQARKMAIDILNFYHNQRSNRSRHGALQRMQPVCSGVSARCNRPQ